MNCFLFSKQGIFNLLFDIIFSIAFIKILDFYIENGEYFINISHLIIIFMIFLNCWTIETVHLNRYEKSSYINIMFMILQIVALLLLLKNNNFSIKYLLATLILISIIFSVQHITEYILIDKKQLILKKLTEPFCYIHIGRTLALLLGLIFINYAYWFIFLAFTVSQLFPSFISRSLHAKDMNFNSLITRIVQLILTINCFIILNNLAMLTSFSILKTFMTCLFIVCFMFIYNYNISLIDLTLTKQSGNTFILGTYFIIFSTFIINYVILGKLNLIFLLFGILGYYIGYISYKQYKKTRT